MRSFIVTLKHEQAQVLSDELLAVHAEHLKSLHEDGHLLICGPYRNRDRVLLIIHAQDSSAAQALVETDPLVQQGHYRSYEIDEFQEANEQNNWLV